MNGQCRSTNARRSQQQVIYDIVLYTDGSVTKDWSGWGFTVKQGGRTVHEDSGTHRVTTSSLTMEVEAVTHAVTVADLPTGHTDYTCHHPHSLEEPAANSGVWDGLPRLGLFSGTDFCGSAALVMPESAGMYGQTGWKAQQTSHLAGNLTG